jgi:hypothetical protein
MIRFLASAKFFVPRARVGGRWRGGFTWLLVTVALSLLLSFGLAVGFGGRGQLSLGKSLRRVPMWLDQPTGFFREGSAGPLGLPALRT